MGRRSFRRSVHDAALGELRRQITYKSVWAHREVIAVDPFYASSETCSACGALNARLKLEKHWLCPACGAPCGIRNSMIRVSESASPHRPH